MEQKPLMPSWLTNPGGSRQSWYFLIFPWCLPPLTLSLACHCCPWFCLPSLLHTFVFPGDYLQLSLLPIISSFPWLELWFVAWWLQSVCLLLSFLLCPDLYTPVCPVLHYKKLKPHKSKIKLVIIALKSSLPLAFLLLLLLINWISFHSITRAKNVRISTTSSIFSFPTLSWELDSFFSLSLPVPPHSHPTCSCNSPSKLLPALHTGPTLVAHSSYCSWSDLPKQDLRLGRLLDLHPLQLWLLHVAALQVTQGDTFKISSLQIQIEVTGGGVGILAFFSKSQVILL